MSGQRRCQDAASLYTPLLANEVEGVRDEVRGRVDKGFKELCSSGFWKGINGRGPFFHVCVCLGRLRRRRLCSPLSSIRGSEREEE